MEEALYETTILRQFAGLSLERIPDETTILNFRRLLEKHELAAGILGVINGLLMGFSAALTPINLMWGFIGCLLGTAIGVLPGIGPALTVALLLPITAKVDPSGALIMFAGIYYGAQFGGSTTSILLNTPGESSSMVTALEGNRMARNGRAGPALATAKRKAERLSHGQCSSGASEPSEANVQGASSIKLCRKNVVMMLRCRSPFQLP